MNVLNLYALIITVQNLQKPHKVFGKFFFIDIIKYVRRIFPVLTHDVFCASKIMGLEIPGKNFQGEIMVHVLYDSVDYVRKLIFVIEFLQRPEMTFVLVVFKGMLDVSGNGSVHIFIGAFFA